jgi:hypothetical protein
MWNAPLRWKAGLAAYPSGHASKKVGGNIAHMRERWREIGQASDKFVLKRMCFIAAFWMQCKELDQ